MPTSSVFSWRDGVGWLVLSGPNDAGSSIRAAALERIAADGAVACLSFGDEADDAVLDDLQDLGAPSGYIVNVVAEDDATIRQQVGDASMVVLTAEGPPEKVRGNLMGAGIEAIEAAHSRGAVVLAEGSAASVFGFYLTNGEGFSWVERAFVTPGVESAAESEEVRRMIAAHPDVVVLGIPMGAAMVFGGDGALETWGEEQVTIALGNAYTSG